MSSAFSEQSRGCPVRSLSTPRQTWEGGKEVSPQIRVYRTQHRLPAYRPRLLSKGLAIGPSLSAQPQTPNASPDSVGFAELEILESRPPGAQAARELRLPGSQSGVCSSLTVPRAHLCSGSRPFNSFSGQRSWGLRGTGREPAALTSRPGRPESTVGTLSTAC